MQQRVSRVDTEFSIQRLLVLNPDGRDTAIVGAGDIGSQAVTHMDGLVCLAVGEFQGLIENRTGRLLLGFLPARGALNEPEVVRSSEEELVVKFPRCPLKEAWRMAGLSEAEVADMCDHADACDHGFFGSEFDYTMDLWSTQPDDACVLTFRPRKKAEKEK